MKPIKEIIPKKYQCSFEECAKIFMDLSSLRKHMLTHGERHVYIIYNKYKKINKFFYFYLMDLIY